MREAILLSKRSASVDLIRVLGAIGIVWFHANMPVAGLGHAGLFVFVILAITFIPKHIDVHNMRRIVRKRVNRILIPWIYWSLIFGVLRILSNVSQGNAPLGWMHTNMLIYGTWAHLWFLPYIFIVNMGVLIFALPQIIYFRFGRLLPFFLGIISLLIPFVNLILPTHIVAPFGEWIFVSPALGAGLLIWVTNKHKISMYIIAGMSLLYIPCGVFYQNTWLWESGVGIFIAVISLVVRLPASTILTYLGKQSMGVYLIHPIPLWFSLRIVSESSLPYKLGAVVFVVASSFCLSAILYSFFPCLLGELKNKSEIMTMKSRVH